MSDFRYLFFPSSVFLHRVSTSSRSVKKKCTELSYDAIMSGNLLQRTLCVNMSYTLERCVGVRKKRELCKNENESNFFSHPRKRQTTQKGSESVIVKLRNFRSLKFRHLSSVSPANTQLSLEFNNDIRETCCGAEIRDLWRMLKMKISRYFSDSE